VSAYAISIFPPGGRETEFCEIRRRPSQREARCAETARFEELEKKSNLVRFLGRRSVDGLQASAEREADEGPGKKAAANRQRRDLGAAGGQTGRK